MSILRSSWHLSSLRTNERTFDVTVRCGDCEVKAHRCILAAQSTVFEEMLYKEEHVENCEVSVEVASESFKDFIKYLYGTNLNVTVDNFGDMLSLASYFKLEELLQQLGDACREIVNKDSFPTLWKLYEVGTDGIRSALLDHASENIRYYLKTTLFDDMSVEIAKTLLWRSSSSRKMPSIYKKTLRTSSGGVPC
eukprot:Filipodium_phascolosomae@DN1719_c0_g1_i1.p1